MFKDLDLIERFHIDYTTLCRWLLSVKKNYRNVTYHNWRHAFNVAQMMFVIITVSHGVFVNSESRGVRYYNCESRVFVIITVSHGVFVIITVGHGCSLL